MSKVVVEFMLGIKEIPLDKRIKKTYHLMAIGSIINWAKHSMVVWGSGIHDYEAPVPDIKFDIRAIRGPLSQNILQKNGIHCPDIYGDPAILLPDFYHPSLPKSKDYLIIPHYSKEKKYINKYDNVISTLTDDWQGFINSILTSNKVISSSLHGIIVAEAYGVPAVMLYDIDKDYLKYNDYYYSTGRNSYKKANSVEEAILMEPDNLPDLTCLKQELYKSFPYDLWS